MCFIQSHSRYNYSIRVPRMNITFDHSAKNIYAKSVTFLATLYEGLEVLVI